MEENYEKRLRPFFRQGSGRRATNPDYEMLFPLPYGVDRKMTGVPYVVYGLAGTNIAVYLGCAFMGMEAYESTVMWGGLIPADLRWWTLLTMHFLHDAPLPFHVGGNMLFLILFGRHIEDALGRWWFALVYLCGGVAAAMMQVVVVSVFQPEGAGTPMIGASGAIAALLGVFAVRFYRTKVRVFWIAGLGLFLNRAGVVRVSSMIVLGLWAAWELVQAIGELGMVGEEAAGGVARWAHLGGLGFGALIAAAAGLHRTGKEVYTKADAYTFFRNGDVKRAADCFTDLLRETPDDPDMHHKLAAALDHTNRPSRALNHYAKAIELYAQRSDLAEAGRIMTRVGGQPWIYGRLDPDIMLTIGDFQLGDRDLPAAYRTFAGLASGQTGRPQAEEACLRCGNILLQHLSRPEKALPWFERVRDRGKVEANVAEATRGAEAARTAAVAERASQERAADETATRPAQSQ